MVTGVATGFSKVMELVGTGYRASVAGKELTLNLGYSKPRVLPIPEGLKVTVGASETGRWGHSSASVASMQGAVVCGVQGHGVGAGAFLDTTQLRQFQCPAIAYEGVWILAWLCRWRRTPP